MFTNFPKTISDNRKQFLCELLIAFFIMQPLWIHYTIPDNRQGASELLSFYRQTDPVLSLFELLGAFLLCHWVYQTKQRKPALPDRIVAALFSVSMLIGTYLDQPDVLDLHDMWDGPFQILKAIFSLIGWHEIFLLLVQIVAILYHRIIDANAGTANSNSSTAGSIFDADSSPYSEDSRSSTHASTSVAEKISRRTFLRDAFYIFCGWLPFCLLCAPGSILYDTNTMLQEAMGHLPLTDHHPFLQVLLYIGAIRLGDLIGHPRLSIFFLTVLQMIAGALVLAWSLRILDDLGIPAKLRRLLRLFYMFCPVFAVYMISNGKDSNYAIVLLAFLCMLTEFCVLEKPVTWKKAILLSLLCILLILLRHNGLYVLLLSAPFILWRLRRSWKQMLCTIAITAIVAATFRYATLQLLHVKKGSEAEAYSVIFQTTARYLRDHGDELTEDDMQIVSSFIHAEVPVPELYNPLSADPVKARYNQDITPSEKGAFFKLWLRMFRMHPETFFAAYAEQYYGYFYPAFSRDVKQRFFLDQTTGYEYYFPAGVAFSNGYFKFWQNTPFLNLSYSCGFWNWLLLWGFLRAIFKRKNHVLFLYIPLLLMMLTVLASPINAYFRYSYPVILCTPFILILTFFHTWAGMTSTSASIALTRNGNKAEKNSKLFDSRNHR